MRTFRPHTARLTSLVFSPDGALLATTAGQSMLVWLWDAATGKLVRKLSGNGQPARAVAFSPDGALVASAQAGPGLNLWRVEAGKLLANLALGRGGSKTLAFTPDGTGLVAPGERKLLRWTFPATWGDPPSPEPIAVKGAERVGFSPTGRLVTALSGVVTVHAPPGSAEPARAFDTPVGYQSAVNGFAFPPDEGRLAVAYGNRAAAVWDLTRPGSRPVLLEGHKGHVRAIGFTRDGRSVITVSLDGTSRVWDPATGAELRVFDWGLGTLTVAAFSPDGLTCAAGADSGHVVVWDVDA